MGLDAMILIFCMLSFKPPFLLSSFTFIKRLFSSSLLSATRVVSSAYLRFLIFLPAILIPACASSSPAFHVMYSAYKLNKQDDNIQPWRTSFPILNQSCCSLPQWQHLVKLEYYITTMMLTLICSMNKTFLPDMNAFYFLFLPYSVGYQSSHFV